MKTSEQLMHEMSSTIIRLELENQALTKSNINLKEVSTYLKSTSEMYRDAALDWKKSTEELQDFVANMLANVGTPVSEEIKKYQTMADS